MRCVLPSRLRRPLVDERCWYGLAWADCSGTNRKSRKRPVHCGRGSFVESRNRQLPGAASSAELHASVCRVCVGVSRGVRREPRLRLASDGPCLSRTAVQLPRSLPRVESDLYHPIRRQRHRPDISLAYTTPIVSASVAFYQTKLKVGSCLVYYNDASNALWLMNDMGTTWLGPVGLGQSGILQNSQCSVNGRGSSRSGSGDSRTLN